MTIPNRISIVTLGVADLDRATAFYESLGWTNSATAPSIAFFEMQGSVLGLYEWTALADDAQVPSEAQLRIAKAQLVGWLEGLFHGIQATLFAQQMAARQQLEQMRGQLGPGVPQPGQPMPTDGESDRPGTYL